MPSAERRSQRGLPSSGTIHCVFPSSGNHYTWKKVTTTVHNIIVGKLWIDQVGPEPAAPCMAAWVPLCASVSPPGRGEGARL